jgi:hypothetical protein
MKTEFEIFNLIRLNHSIEQYDIEQYREKSNIFVFKEEIVNKGKGIFEEYRTSYDFWKKYKYTYKNLIRIEFFEQIIYLPTIIFFGKLDDWKLISYLAIINYFKPKVHYEFYRKGESLKNIKNEVVENENTLVKNIVCLKNGEELSLKEFAIIEIDELKNKNKLIEIVEDYLYQDHKELSFIIEETNENESFRENYFYNDQLDTDQQSPEFWDNL